MNTKTNSTSKAHAREREPSTVRATIVLCAFALVGAAVSTYSHAQTAKQEKETARKDVYVQVVPKVSEGERAFNEKTEIVREAYRARELKRQRDELALPALKTLGNEPGSGA